MIFLIYPIKNKFPCAKSAKGIFIKSRNIKQGELYLSSFLQPFQDFSLVSAKRNILPINISISSLYLSQQLTLWVLAITEQSPHTHIIGKETEQQGILTIAFEVFKAFPKVGTEQGVCLPFRHIRREVLSWLQLMTISYIRKILRLIMKSLKVFNNNHTTFERRQVCQPHPTLGKDGLAE